MSPLVRRLTLERGNSAGLLASGEDIKVLELSLGEALAKIKTGDITDAKTIIGIYWLENRHLNHRSS